MADQKPIEISPLERYKKTLELIESKRIFILLTGESAEQVFKALEITGQRETQTFFSINFNIPGVIDSLKKLKRKRIELSGSVFSLFSQRRKDCNKTPGRNFIFTNHFDKSVTKKCRREKIFHAAGALTPKEVYEANEQGADAVSIYPCSSIGGV